MFETSIKDLSELVTLVKEDGRRLQIYAEVQTETAFIPDIDTPIEIDDIIERPRGSVVDRYVVTNVLPWNRALDFDCMFEPHIQASITPLRKSQLYMNNTMNVSGNISASTVVINSGNDASISVSANQNNFDALIRAISEADAPVEIIASVNDLRDIAGTPSFKTKYNDFIASLANHATVFQAVAPFISWLSNL